MTTLDSYDAIPYDAVSITDTHPDRLHVLGKLFGLPAAPPERCRVLELGCADGANLTPMAFHLPESRFVGVDLSRVQVESGQTLIRDAGLSNVELRHADVMTLDASLGQFDYVIAHGLYSWVPRPVQDRILALCGELLAPHGIAYVSYNVLPGWRGRGMLRDMLLHHCRDAATPRAKLEAAEQFLDQAGAVWAELDAPAIGWLRQEVEQLRDASRSYLFHEYLEDTNAPILFSEFAQRAAHAGLRYLCETDVYSMVPSALGARAAHVLENIDDLIEQEQYNDFLRARPFRRTLLCRADAPLSRDIELETLARFGVSAYLTCHDTPDPSAPVPQDYVAASGKRFAVTHPVTKHGLGALQRVHPNSLTVNDLVAGFRESRPAADSSIERHTLLAELFSLFSLRAIHFTPRAELYFNAVSDRPRAHALARLQAMRGHATSARHTDIDLDPLSAHLLRHLDGSRTHAELTDLLLDELRRHPARRSALLGRDANPSAQRTRIADNVQRLLMLFARHGLLAA
jgi:SAM-dependent methyltransferase